MKKEITALVLALAMTAGMAQGAFAAEPDVPEFDENDYTEVVVFSDGGQENGIQPMSETDPVDNINQAKAGVRALKLGKLGFDYLEEACLAELDEMEKSGEVTLHEYAVLVPKARAATPSYCGSYNGVDFYTSAVSKGIYETQKHTEISSTRTKEIALFAANLYMCFNLTTKAASLGWTAITSQFSGSYSYHDEDYIEAYAMIDGVTRTVFVIDGSSYRAVYTREYGMVTPYTVYHRMQMTDAITVVEHDPVMYPDLDGTTYPTALMFAYGAASAVGVSYNYPLSNVISFVVE